MANRKRATVTLPDELRTTEKLSTKKELAQRKSVPACPYVPSKIFRKSILASNGASDKPKPIYFNNAAELSSDYDPTQDTTYFEQMYPDHSLIGEGSFGQVYKARGAYDNIYYAIKRLKPMISDHDRYAEVRNNEKVGVHPNCVQFFMAWEEGCEVFMLLESCEMSLSDYANKNSDICEELLWHVLYDICHALKYLHGKQLLHLDVKPDNIMMKNGYYKLADFGILVDLNMKPLSCTSTLSDGDSKYLAVEVLNGIYTPFCDIFGLGLSLLELAADLELPSHGPLWQQLRHEILPQAFYDRVSREFKVIIEKMLKPEYQKRPTSEGILKYSSLRSIEKRDKTKARKNFAAESLNRNRDDNDNNNVIDTPRCLVTVNSVNSEYCRFNIENRPRVQISPKNLFKVQRRREDTSTDKEFSSQKASSFNSSDADSNSLASALHDVDEDPMETDEVKLDDADMVYIISEDEGFMASTPIIRNKFPGKVLTFD